MAVRVTCYSTTGTERAAMEALGLAPGASIQAGPSRFYFDFYATQPQLTTVVYGAMPATLRVRTEEFYGTLAEHRARVAARCLAWNGSTVGVDFGDITGLVVISGDEYDDEYPWCVKDEQGNITITEPRFDGRAQVSPSLYVDNCPGDVTVIRPIALSHGWNTAVQPSAVFPAIVIGGAILGKVRIIGGHGSARAEKVGHFTLPQGVEVDGFTFIDLPDSENANLWSLHQITAMPGRPEARRRWNGESFDWVTELGDPWIGLGGTETEIYRGATMHPNLRGGYREADLRLVEAPASGNVLEWIIPADLVSLWPGQDLREAVWYLDQEGGEYQTGRCTLHDQATRRVRVECFAPDGSPSVFDPEKVIRWNALQTKYAWPVTWRNLLGGGHHVGSIGSMYLADGWLIENCVAGQATGDYTYAAEHSLNGRMRNCVIPNNEHTEVTFWAINNTIENVRFIGNAFFGFVANGCPQIGNQITGTTLFEQVETTDGRGKAARIRNFRSNRFNTQPVGLTTAWTNLSPGEIDAAVAQQTSPE